MNELESLPKSDNNSDLGPSGAEGDSALRDQSEQERQVVCFRIEGDLPSTVATEFLVVSGHVSKELAIISVCKDGERPLTCEL